jgi:hypothetical protein
MLLDHALYPNGTIVVHSCQLPHLLAPCYCCQQFGVNLETMSSARDIVKGNEEESRLKSWR